MASTSSPSNLCKIWTSIPDEELKVKDVESLALIEDDVWVVSACVDRLLDDSVVQKLLLELGIYRSDKAVERCKVAFSFIGPDEPDLKDQDQPQAVLDVLNSNFRDVPSDVQLCNLRIVLLERLDKLSTFVQMEKESLQESNLEGLEDWEDDPWTEDAAASSLRTKELQLSVQASPRLPFTLSTFFLIDLKLSACQLASLQCISAVRILIHRHATSLWPYRFTILESIPEHTDIALYRDLLPSFNMASGSEETMNATVWRTSADFVESHAMQSALASHETSLKKHSKSDGIISTTEAHPTPLTGDELTTWYMNRVYKILSSTGMVDIALALIQHGASQAISALDELGEELSLLSRLVYDACQSDDIIDDWTLSKWYSMDPPEVIRAYLSHSSPESISNDILRLVMPYLYVLESRAERAGAPDSNLHNRFLYDYILASPLDIIAPIFEASKPTMPVAQRLIRSDEDAARLALSCLYGSKSLDQWPAMSRIFECMPAWDVPQYDSNATYVDVNEIAASIGDSVTPSATHPIATAKELFSFFKPMSVTSLSRALDFMDIHLESGEILARWGVPAPLHWFLRSQALIDEQRAWANRMARRASGSRHRLDTEEDWEWLLEDMLKLTGKSDNGLQGAFGLLAKDEVIKIFFSGLLSTGEFNIAKNMIYSNRSKDRLASDVVEDICIACSHELYDNAGSGNYNFGEMKLAYECLDVPRSSDRLLHEKEFIEATSRISSFNVTSRQGVSILPIEIRLAKDRLSLISRLLSNNADAYKHAEVILDLCYKLGFRGDPTAEVKVLAMLADTALQVEDFKCAYENTERMVNTVFTLLSSSHMGIEDPKVKESIEVCWIACFQLGRNSSFDDLKKKMFLLGRCLELCPAGKLNDVLITWKNLEKEFIREREERLRARRSGATVVFGSHKHVHSAPSNVASSLRARLQDFHMPSPPLLSTPDAAALASRTFRSVAANFPFSVSHRDRSQPSEDGGSRRSGSARMLDVEDVSSQASRVLSKGIGWLIGADEGGSS